MACHRPVLRRVDLWHAADTQPPLSRSTSSREAGTKYFVTVVALCTLTWAEKEISF